MRTDNKKKWPDWQIEPGPEPQCSGGWLRKLYLDSGRIATPSGKINTHELDQIWLDIGRAIGWLVSPAVFELHFRGSMALSLDASYLTVQVRDRRSIVWLHARLLPTVERAAAAAGWSGLAIQFVGPETGEVDRV